MTESEFKKRYELEKPIYEAWGDYVTQIIKQALITHLGGTNQVDAFLKVPATPRVKDINSIITKAFYRGKNYKNPYEDITDKVGVRFVALLLSHVDQISDIVQQQAEIWTYSKDRNFEEEKLQKPLIFDYQSVHYIVRNIESIESENITIPPNTPCEIQIRTLQQHSYSELTHDLTYKPKFNATPEVQRLTAKSMALIEVTDGFFQEVENKMNAIEQTINKTANRLNSMYSEITEPDYAKSLNDLLLDSFRDFIDEVSLEEVGKFVSEQRKIIASSVQSNYNTSLIHRQPVVLLLYYLIAKHKHQLRQMWPLTDDEIRPLFADLGIKFDFTF